ncbi:MAG: Lar family restriction alleviation protein [Burkholderiales bacterium]|nr:Lar family restriction alleviation protein [Burkholderiales bacterium]
MADNKPATPKRCAKCGSPGELMKAGSNRFWVQCAKYGRNGNCNVIGAQMETKKQAIERWNAVN